MTRFVEIKSVLLLKKQGDVLIKKSKSLMVIVLRFNRDVILRVIAFLKTHGRITTCFASIFFGALITYYVSDYYYKKSQKTTHEYSLEDLISNGDSCFNMKKYDEAIQYYTKALNIDPQDATTWRNKGIAYIGLGTKDIDFRYCIDNCQAYDLDHFMKALPCFDKAIEIDPKDKKAYLYRGIVWYRWGNLDPLLGPPNNNKNARSQFEKAISITLDKVNIDPQMWQYQTACAYYGIGKVMERWPEKIANPDRTTYRPYRDEARKFFQKAKELDVSF
jgi:tetratricopeptide (TPR) repeat protein